MDASRFNRTADILKVLGHPVRLCIVHGLVKQETCNVSYIQSCLNIPQSTVSQHMSKLKSAGIIEGTRKGLEIVYRVVDEDAFKIIETLYPGCK
ncbi:ArsR family transcriptional regulator [Natranaerovirga hydrolytica]|uniref:ArsR family transcriptional regulator n=1 Tax=Natranaerovirga hydrolytica TaxID=680378 RepID=A0A4R1M9Y9_9FIRM|nr:ArsR family transcriptional regulator [Natranaerovirga hydrolytica]